MPLAPLIVPPALLTQNIPLALALMVVSSFLFAGGATVQHLAVGGTVDDGAQSMNLRQVLSLLSNPRWLAGIGLAAVGASIHIVALMLAPVTVVQPVGILAVPWSVLLAAKIHGFRPNRIIWGAVGLTIIGIVWFTLISASTAAPDTSLTFSGVLLGSLVVFGVGAVLGLLGRGGHPAWRCLMWASGGSFYYGLSSALIKVISHELVTPEFWTHPLIWVAAGALVICYLGGGWMIQQAYASGPAEIVVGSMTTTDPIVAVGFGLVVLGEGVRVGLLDAFGMALAGAVAISGVLLLSRHHPDAISRREETQLEAAA